MRTPFTRKTLAFLRALKRNNDREWFRARKPEYEQHVRGPMVALLSDDDQHRARCAAAMRRIRVPMVTVWPALIGVLRSLRAGAV